MSTNNKQEEITIADVFNELEEKINKVNDYNRKTKTAIYKEYAEKLAQYMPVMMIRYELMRKFEKDKNIIKYALSDPKYIDINKEQSSIRSDRTSGMTSTNDEKNDIDKEIEKDAKVIQLKEQIETLKAEINRLKEPLAVHIDKKFLTKIREENHSFILIKDNYIWQSWDHNPTPQEWKNATEAVGF